MVVSGCAEAPAASGSVLAGRPGGARYAIFLNGTRADEGKRQRCDEEIQAAGGVSDPSSPVRAVLTLEEYGNKLEIVSAARGIVQNTDLPKWDMRRLCREAMAALGPAIAQEPPPGYSGATAARLPARPTGAGVQAGRGPGRAAQPAAARSGRAEGSRRAGQPRGAELRAQRLRQRAGRLRRSQPASPRARRCCSTPRSATRRSTARPRRCSTSSSSSTARPRRRSGPMPIG